MEKSEIGRREAWEEGGKRREDRSEGKRGKKGKREEQIE